MVKELEIEFKNMLNKEEFDELKYMFEIEDNDFIRQSNDYFDTASLALKTNQSALRIRQKNHTFVLTLKQPGDVGLIETHQPLSQKEASQLFASGQLPTGEVRDALEAMDIQTERLYYLGRLSTDRAEWPYKCGTLTLDHSYYLNTDDYELEYEVKDKKQGENAFNSLLRQFAIPKRPTKNKIQRFYDFKTEHDK